MTDLDTRPRSRAPVPEPPPPAAAAEGVEWKNLAGAGVLLALLILAVLAGGWPLVVMIGALVLMIFLHELGHYVAAKRAGMKVTEFFLGFGPRIWSFRRGETEYGVKALWLGAYVKIVGMHNLDDYDPADVERTYLSKPYWRRMSVALAGSFMHFVLAVVVLFVAVGVVGVPSGRVIVSEADVEAALDGPWEVLEVVEDAPAAELGVQRGDRIVSLDGVSTVVWDDFVAAVAPRAGKTVEVVIVRDGVERVETVTIGRREGRGFFGVGHYPAVERRAPVAAAGETFRGFASAVGATFEGLGTIFSPSGLTALGSEAFGRDDPGPPVPGGDGEEEEEGGSSGVGVAGLVGITGLGSEALRQGLYGDWLVFFAAVNVFIGIFNLVPLLPLDGGHAAIATYEKIRSLFRRGEPYHVDVAKLLPLTYAVFAVLVFVAVSTLVLDTRRLLGS